METEILFWFPPSPGAMQCNKEVINSVLSLAEGTKDPFSSIKSEFSQKMKKKTQELLSAYLGNESYPS